MNVVAASSEILFAPDDLERRIEVIGRKCYKSEARITADSAVAFVRMLNDRHHYPMFDHGHISALFVTNRGVSHELVRHRIAAYAQESTRYCNYGRADELTFISPTAMAKDWTIEDWEDWSTSCLQAETAYLRMVRRGRRPEEARDVLPNALKTEIVATFDVTAWRHVFALRCAKTAHPQMREVMTPLRDSFVSRWPAFFEDLLLPSAEDQIVQIRRLLNLTAEESIIDAIRAKLFPGDP